MAALGEQIRTEAQRSALLNVKRNQRTETLGQRFRKGLMEDTQNMDPDEGPEEGQTNSQHRNRLSLLRASAIKQANQEAGATVGEVVGGAVGSIVPGPGNVIGIFIGRYFGRKWGITGIILFAFALILSSLVFYLFLLKSACDTSVFAAADYFTINICPIFK